MRVSAVTVMKLVSPEPARQDVQVNVRGYPGAGSFAQVHAQIDAIRMVDRA